MRAMNPTKGFNAESFAVKAAATRDRGLQSACCRHINAFMQGRRSAKLILQ
jgi:hypothetical protein